MKKVTNCPLIIGIVHCNHPAMMKKCLECGMDDAMDSTFQLDALYECICSLRLKKNCVQPFNYQNLSGVLEETSFFDWMGAVATEVKPRNAMSNAFDAFGHVFQNEQDCAMHELWEFGTNTPIYM